MLDMFLIPHGKIRDTAEKVGALADRLAREGAAIPDEELTEVFDKLFDAGLSKAAKDETEYFRGVKKFLEGKKIYVPEEVRAEYGDDWADASTRARAGRVPLTDDPGGERLDVLNMELAEKYPGLFDSEDADMKHMLDNILSALDNAETKWMTLEEEARSYGGEEALQNYRDELMGKYMKAIAEYADTTLGAKAGRSEAIAELKRRSEEKIQGYIQHARETMRGRAAEGLEVPGGWKARYDKENKAHPDNIEARGREAREKRLRSNTRDEFEGTPALEKLGVKIARGVGLYDGLDAIKANAGEEKKIKRAVAKARERLHAPAKEELKARGIAAGTYDAEDIPPTMDAERVMELADYFTAESANSQSALKRRRQDVRRIAAEKIEHLMRDTGDAKSVKKLAWNTPERNMREIYGDKKGMEIYKNIFQQVSENEAEGIRWLNTMKEKVRVLKLDKKESPLVHMILDLRNTEELIPEGKRGETIRDAARKIKGGADLNDTLKDLGLGGEQYDENKDLAVKYAHWTTAREMYESGKYDRAKIDNAVNVIARIFDDTHEARNDFLIAHGHEPVPKRKGYAPHIRLLNSRGGLWGDIHALMAGESTRTLPAEIAGLTEGYRPYKRYDPHAQPRMGDGTDYDILRAFPRYMEIQKDIFFHTDDIYMIRGMEEYLRRVSSDKEINNNISQAENMRFQKPEEQAEFLRRAGAIDQGSELTPDDLYKTLNEYINEQYRNAGEKTKHANTVMYLQNYANGLAGKQQMSDRPMERTTGRESLNIGNRLVRIFAQAKVGFNMASFINQFSQAAMIIAENGPVHTAAAIGDIMSGELRRAGFAEQSDYLTGVKGSEPLTKSIGEDIMNGLFKPLKVGDWFTSQLTVRSRYRKETAKGKSHEEAMREADRYARNMKGSRVKGERPEIYDKKNPLWKLLTIFQVEIAAMWDHITKDLPYEFREIVRERGKAAAIGALAAMAGTYLFTERAVKPLALAMGI